ncbi:MAG: glycosyltransferase [Rhodocyclaceae bacterium]|nr:glycosyltransferase [Rhodocyclaceae bacterium]
MKILLAQPGKLHTVPMGRFALDALRKLGHDVVDFNLSSLWHDKVLDRLRGSEDQASVNKRFRRVVDSVRPDLMLTIFGFNLSEASLDMLKQRGIARVCWWLNDPFQFKRSLDKASHYDFLFSNSLGSVADYHEAGIRHAYWLPTACAPEIHRRAEVLPDYRCEVCFAGDWSPLREAWCTELARHFDIRVWGPWRKKLHKDSPLHCRLQNGFFSPVEMSRMFSNAEVVFNLHSWHGKWMHGTNPRLFEAAGCGACQVVDWKEDIPKLFDTERDLLTYKTQDELVAKIRQLLADTKLRRALGENAQRNAYANHTYEVRMREMMKILEHGL